jgi:hypothetical protein
MISGLWTTLSIDEGKKKIISSQSIVFLFAFIVSSCRSIFGIFFFLFQLKWIIRHRVVVIKKKTFTSSPIVFRFQIRCCVCDVRSRAKVIILQACALSFLNSIWPVVILDSLYTPQIIFVIWSISSNLRLVNDYFYSTTEEFSLLFRPPSAIEIKEKLFKSRTHSNSGETRILLFNQHLFFFSFLTAQFLRCVSRRR